MDLIDVRRALAERLRERCPDWNVSDYVIENPVPPCLVVGFPESVTYRQTLSGRVEIAHTVTVVTGLIDQALSQQLMDAALGTGTDSVATALDSAQSDAWQSCLVVSADGMRAVPIGNGTYLACDINLSIKA